MPLDPTAPITPLQSGTIRAALKAIAVNVVAIVAVVTGKALDIDLINQAIDLGVPLIFNGISIYYAYKSIRGRINATETITKG
jgi:hypothetical protein